MADIEKSILIDVNIDNKDAQRQLEQVNIALEKNKIQVRELKKAYDAGEISIDQYAKEATQLKIEQQKLTDSQRILTKEVKAESNSIDALRANLARLTKERNQTNTSTAEGAAEFNRLQVEIKQTTDELSKLEQAGGDFRRNVGNYQSAVNPLSGAFNSVKESAIGLFKTLIANPIVAITAALVGLYNIVKQNDEAAVFFEGAQRAVGVVIGKVADIIVDGTKAVYNFFTQTNEFTDFIKSVFIRVLNQMLVPLNVLIDTLKVASLIMEGDMAQANKVMAESIINNGKALVFMNDETYGLSQSLSDLTDEVIGSTQASLDYAKALDEMEMSLSKFSVTEQELINQRDRLRLQAKDLTKTEEERIALLEKADKIDQDLLNQRLGLINEQIKIERDYQNVLAKGSTEYEEQTFKINALEKERLQAENERLVFQEKAINQRNKLIEKQREQDAKDAEERQKQLEKERQAEEEAFNRAISLQAREDAADFKLNELKLSRAIELEKQKLNNAELSAQERIAIVESLNQKELELINLREQQELENADLTRSEWLLIEEKYQIERTKLAEKTQKDIDKIEKEGAVTKQQVEQVKGQAVAGFFNLASTLAEGNKAAEKAIGIGQAVVNTAVAVTKALATYGPTPIGFAAAGTAVASGAAQIVKISKAAGGGNFKTKGPTLLLVGDNPGGVEHVSVTPISGKGKTEIHGPNLMAMAGGGTLTAGSGIVTESVTSGFNNINATQKVLSDSFKNMPSPVVSVKEVTRKQNRVKAKETSNL